MPEAEETTEKDADVTEQGVEQEQAPPPPPGVPVTIDGQLVYADKGELLIEAAERVGSHIPRFCYHERLRPVGMCRMCLVEVDSGRGPMLSPACLVECTPDMKVETRSDKALKAQDGVIEFLLVNHPLDCPVCDKGGECPLQDNTIAFGPGESRMVEEKRHREKPIPLSDLVLLDRERCILCDRCTRFADEVAGDPLIQFIQRGVETEVNTFPNDPFASYFSGNTVQLCPVGALTSKPYRFAARPWDLESAESTCTTCSVGCRIAVQSSGTEVTRYLGLDSDPVNHGWLCDKGRFAYESINNTDARVTAPMVRKHGELVEVSWGEALAAAAKGIKDALDRHGPSSVGIIGGARLTNEDAFAWAKLAKDVIGTNNVDCQLDDGLPAEIVLGLPKATIDEACAAPVVVLLAPDLKQELPVLFLRLRDSVTKGTTKLIELTPASTAFTPFAATSLMYRPGEAAAVAAALVDDAPAADIGPVSAASITAARQALKTPGVVVILGRPSTAEAANFVADAALVLNAGLTGVKFLSALRRANVHGALGAGLAPTGDGLDTGAMLRAASNGKLAALVLLGSDPATDVPDASLAQRGLAGAGFTIAVEAAVSPSSSRADVILPAATFAERNGSTTNIEGRVTRVSQKVPSPGVAWEDWMIAAELAGALGGDLGFETVEDVAAAAGLSSDVAAGDGTVVAPPTAFSARSLAANADIPMPALDAYSLRLVSGRMLYDNGWATASSPSLANLAKPVALRANPRDLDRLGVTTGAQVRVSGAHASFVVAVKADPGVPLGSAWLPVNVAVDDARSLIDASSPVTDVRIENV
ncbi:MAG: NADH-quinone oxidoreductase subunit NuoG [Actinobacteria bacterium]|nr:NADH-quinone oxidoreductase subunit NuoG [Actinomycetota bacterium]